MLLHWLCEKQLFSPIGEVKGEGMLEFVRKLYLLVQRVLKIPQVILTAKPLSQIGINADQLVQIGSKLDFGSFAQPLYKLWRGLIKLVELLLKEAIIWAALTYQACFGQVAAHIRLSMPPIVLSLRFGRNLLHKVNNVDFLADNVHPHLAFHRIQHGIFQSPKGTHPFVISGLILGTKEE